MVIAVATVRVIRIHGGGRVVHRRRPIVDRGRVVTAVIARPHVYRPRPVIPGWAVIATVVPAAVIPVIATVVPLAAVVPAAVRLVPVAPIVAIPVAVAATMIVGAGNRGNENRTKGDGGKKLGSQHGEAP